MRKTRMHHLRRALTLTCALVFTIMPLIISTTHIASAGDKMKAEDVVAKHLEAIGSEAARAGAQSRVIAGSSRAIFRARNSSGAIDGRVVIASEHMKVLYGMGFNASNYPGEKFGFDGKKFTVGYLTPGIRSPLGNFALTYSELFKEGLMGGTLSSAWPLLNLAERKAKLEYAGTDKIKDQPVHKLKYYPNKSSDLQITLYFDATTFQHVRTLYERIIGARLGTGGVDSSASQRETRYRIIEDFAEYKQEGKLNLPHSYTLQLEIQKTGGSSMDKWEMTLSQFAFNEAIDDKAFNVEAD